MKTIATSMILAACIAFQAQTTQAINLNVLSQLMGDDDAAGGKKGDNAHGGKKGDNAHGGKKGHGDKKDFSVRAFFKRASHD